MRAATLRAVRALRHQRMPLEEICAILGAEDPLVVRHYLELHRERLEERLADERCTLEEIERAVIRVDAHPAPANT